MIAIRPDFREDDEWPAPAFWRELNRRARRGRVLAIGPGLEMTGRGLARVGSRALWARITGAAPAYGFAEVEPAAGGGWSTLAGGRTDDGGRTPAYEANGVAGLAGTYQRLRFSAAGDWRFREVRSGSAGGGGGGPTPPACGCGNFIPSVTCLQFTSNSNCNCGMYQSATLTYSATPAPGYYGPPMSYSCGSNFPGDPLGQVDSPFQYFLACVGAGASLGLYAIAPGSDPNDGQIAAGGQLATWAIAEVDGACSIVNPASQYVPQAFGIALDIPASGWCEPPYYYQQGDGEIVLVNAAGMAPTLTLTQCGPSSILAGSSSMSGVGGSTSSIAMGSMPGGSALAGSGGALAAGVGALAGGSALAGVGGSASTIAMGSMPGGSALAGSGGALAAGTATLAGSSYALGFGGALAGGAGSMAGSSSMGGVGGALSRGVGTMPGSSAADWVTSSTGGPPVKPVQPGD